jgi:hypothetical protein
MLFYIRPHVNMPLFSVPKKPGEKLAQVVSQNK